MQRSSQDIQFYRNAQMMDQKLLCLISLNIEKSRIMISWFSLLRVKRFKKRSLAEIEVIY